MTDTALYSIRVEGHLDRSWVEWFDGLEALPEPGGTTLLTGTMRDQAALYSLLSQLGSLGLTLVTVERGAGRPDAAVVRPEGDRCGNVDAEA